MIKDYWESFYKYKKPLIVYTYVCADIIHWGHIRYLKKAKEYGNFLVVGVLTEHAIMEKKPKPIIPFKERIKIIQSIKYVDLVVSQETYSPLLNIKKIRPNILIESYSHTKEDIKKLKIEMKKIGGKVITIPYYPSQSSTQIKRKLRGEK